MEVTNYSQLRAGWDSIVSDSHDRRNFKADLIEIVIKFTILE